MAEGEVDPLEDLLVAVGFLTCGFLKVAIPVFFVAPFIARCDLGVAAMVLPPLCHRTAHASPLLTPLWVVVQWLGYTLMMEQLASYMYLMIFLVACGTRFLHEVG